MTRHRLPPPLDAPLSYAPPLAAPRPQLTARLLVCTILFAGCTGDSGAVGGTDEPSEDARPSSGSAPDADAPPSFQVDSSWPRELPNDWILGSITSVFVDAQDHVWITHLPETLTPE